MLNADEAEPRGVEAQRAETRRTQRAAFTVATLSAFLMPFMGAAGNIAIPTIGASLHMDAVALTWVATSFLLATAIALLPAGRVADMFGRKRIFLVGTTVYTLASLLCGLAPSGGALIAARAVQGVGASMIFGTGLAILTSVFPPGERGKAIGINVAAVYVGLSVGPYVGGVLVHEFGWRSVFFVNVLLGAIVLLTIQVGLRGKEWKEGRTKQFDVPGTAVYTLSLVGLMYGVSLYPDPSGILLTVAAIGGMVGFWFLEARRTSPLLDVSLFRGNAQFTLSNLAALIHYSATFGMTFLLSIYLQSVKGLDPKGAGLILIAQPIMMAVVSPFAGKISDRLPPQIVASVGMAITTASLTWMGMLGADTPTEHIVVMLGLLGFGFALFSSPNTNAVMSAVQPSSYGIASATIGTMRVMGQMLSMAIATLIIGQKVGRIQLAPGMADMFVEGFRTTVRVFAGLCFIGIGFSAARGRGR
jgi:EmrB/QacA subfamily drug resistance transporter